MSTKLIIPSESDLSAFFGCEPTTSNPSEGQWHYAVNDSTGIKLDFVLNYFERSVRADLFSNKVQVASVTHEELNLLSVYKDLLNCEFENANFKVTATIRVHPNISMIWGCLKFAG